ncbi:MAG: DUF1836 domain-containing protein [Clostridia bacterium]|nr:DUF1836 domain-containing protein [Clostridia bacterium]
MEKTVNGGREQFCLPGTVIRVNDIGKEGGRAFFAKVFFVTDRVMLSHIRGITGLDTMALQNWVKRKWVANPEKKTYSRDHLARFLIVNMLRDTLQIARIMYLLRYLNGTEPEDVLVPEPEIYHYVCLGIGELLAEGSEGPAAMDAIVDRVIADFDAPSADAKRRLKVTISIMLNACYASMLKEKADRKLDEIGAPHDPKIARLINGG